jgi:hypothetical protein
MFYLIWVAVLFTAPLCSMEPSSDDNNKAIALPIAVNNTRYSLEFINPYHDKQPYEPFERLCDQSHYLGYHYSSVLKELGRTSKFFYNKVRAGDILRENRLREAIGAERSVGGCIPEASGGDIRPEFFSFDGHYAATELVFNKLGNACGWKQWFCTHCLSPEWCKCGPRLPHRPAALYRAQLDGGDNTLVEKQGCNGGKKSWCWESKAKVKIYKTCIESKILCNIIELKDTLERYNAPKLNWNSLYIPKEHERNQGDYKLDISAPFFNRDDEVVVREMKILGSSEWINGFDWWGAPHCVERSLNEQGKHILRALSFTLGKGKEYPLTCISYLPTFYHLLKNRPERVYTDSAITINAVEILSEHFGFSETHRELLQRMIPSSDNGYSACCYRLAKDDLLPAARCAQIGGADDEANCLLNSYMHKVVVLSRQGRIHMNPFGKLYAYHERGKPNHYRDNNCLQALSHYTIDAVHRYEREQKLYGAYIIFSPHHRITGYEDPPYFTEVCTIGDQPCTLNLWRKKERRVHITPEEYAIPSTILLTPASYAIPCDALKNLVIIAGTMLYVLKQKSDDPDIPPHPGLALLTEEESANGSSIAKMETDDIQHSGILHIHMNPLHWWEHFRQPIKQINVVDMSVHTQWKYHHNFFHLLKVANDCLWDLITAPLTRLTRVHCYILNYLYPNQYFYWNRDFNDPDNEIDLY